MGGFILGLDGDTPDVFDIHIKFIEQSAVCIAMEGLLTALRGTDLYLRMEREGRLRQEDTTGTSVNVNLNFVPEMPEEILKAGYKRVLNTIYDHGLKNYFERCWTLLQRIDRSKAPTPMSTPLNPYEIVRFLAATARQMVSAQGPAYLQFLARVITQNPTMLSEAFTLGAKGYHLRKLTEQVTAVDNFRQYLTSMSEHFREELAHRARESNTRARAYASEVILRVQQEYARIHKDFRHTTEDALRAFLDSLEIALKKYDPSV